MEWVETSGRTVEEAKEAALEALGVAPEDAEFEVVQETKGGLFGLRKAEARVRARVRPQAPRPKAERRAPGGKRRSGGGSGDGGRGEAGGGGRGQGRGQSRGGREPASTGQGRREPDDRAATVKEQAMTEASQEGAGTAEAAPVDLAQQREDVDQFLRGLVEALQVEGSVRSDLVDDEVRAVIDGEQVGLLIGPSGTNLRAIQEITRTVVQRRSQGGYEGRVTVDVANYWERRRSALELFARELAAEVASSGVAKALEPMGSADRKVVHDAVVEIDGVMTTSEGEEPRRRVVIRPDVS